jgi:hypothetical protein
VLCGGSKVLTMYQIYHTWIHPLHCFLSPPSPEQFQQVSFLHLQTCVYTICTIFILLPLSMLHPPFLQCQPHPTLQSLFHPLVFPFCRRKNIRDNQRNMVFLLIWDKGSYTRRFLVFFPCITTPVDSSLPVLFTSPEFPSYGVQPV